MAALIYTLCTIFNINFILSREILSMNSDNYGPFIIEYDNFEQCAGPKKVNSTTYEARIEKNPDSGVYKLYYNVTTHKDIKIEKMYIRVYNMKKNRKNVLWSYRVEHFCQHYLLIKMMEETFHAPNCQLKKGIHVSELDLNEFTKLYFGKCFFYGELYFKTVILSRNANMICLITKARFVKKINNK